ncbi:MAG: hypothetical protein OQL06_09270 [Gammaproteobacteria bacterium]|nr:hypothetical protein [Gammaproteobacteria bacterium]
MISLARFIMAGPGQAIMVAAVAAILAALLPPVAWISGGVIALVVLHLGPQKGMQVMAIACAAAIGLGWIAGGVPLVILVSGVVLLLWMPVWLAAVTLRQTVSLSLAVQLIIGLGVLLVLLLQWVFPQLHTELAADFSEMIGPVVEQQQSETAKQELNDAINIVLPLMPGLLAAGMMMGCILSLILGRWWQAALYNPGGLASEFNSLRLGRILAGTGAALMLVAALASSALATMLALVVLSAYLVQGVAIVHSIADAKNINRGWLFGLYVMIFMLPHLVVLPLAVLGLTDAWIDFRRRLTTN